MQNRSPRKYNAIQPHKSRILLKIVRNRLEFTHGEFIRIKKRIKESIVLLVAVDKFSVVFLKDQEQLGQNKNCEDENEADLRYASDDFNKLPYE